MSLRSTAIEQVGEALDAFFAKPLSELRSDESMDSVAADAVLRLLREHVQRMRDEAHRLEHDDEAFAFLLVLSLLSEDADA